MFSALRHRTAALALGVCFILPVHASSPKPGDFANTQARHIATFFPGRMTGTPAEMLSADYIRQQFQQMGYRSDIRTFNSRYIYTARDNRKSWHNVTGSTVIAAHEGKTPQQIIAYLEKMQQLQVGSVFSSLQIPGDDPGTLQDTLAQVGPLFRRQGLEFVVDVSPRTFRNFTLEQLRSWGVTSLRIDNGMEPQEIAEISHDFRIVLNASTLNDPFLDALQQHGFHGELEAWHNYYPRRNTGLDVRFFEARNNWLKAHGVRSAAFFAGNSELRGTVFEGLPTLERHRTMPPFQAYLELQDRYGLDNILLGDFDLAEPDFTQLKALRGRSTLLLHVQDLHEPAILHRPLRNRIDIAQDVIRADAFRRQNKTSYPPRNNVARSVGTVTIDNVDYGRYMGELQIDLCPLPADPRVNVVAQVCEPDLALLPYAADPAYQFEFCE